MKSLVYGGCLGLFLLSAEIAVASPMQFKFSGQVYAIADNGMGADHVDVPGGTIAVGDTYSATFSFESSIPDSVADPGYGSYSVTPPGMSITFGGGEIVWTADAGESGVGIRDFPDYDVLDLGSYGFAPRGFAYLSVGAHFTDRTGTVLASDAIPLTTPRLDGFQEVYLEVHAALEPSGSGSGRHFKFAATITSLELVPEPTCSALFLMVVALSALRPGRDYRLRR